MEASPLTQDARLSLQPKIASLYEDLFQDTEEQLSDGYWREFFLLKPDRQSFQQCLGAVNADQILLFNHETQKIFSSSIQYLKTAELPTDEYALDTLTVFLAGVLSKRYTNPSSDIITVLAGLDSVDTVFTDFANAIETTIRAGRSLEVRRKAIEVALSLTSGAYQTSLVSYFTHRDLFPALMKYIQDVDSDESTFEPFLLLGLLANYNKFEFRNPYRVRLEDFVNEATVLKIVSGVGAVCKNAREKYTTVYDDVPDTSWTLANALAYIGLGMLAPIKAINPMAVPEDDKEKFAELPPPEASILLSLYDFVAANKIFSYNLLTSTAKDEPSPASSYLSFVSYILHHAFRSTRATTYSILSLSTLRLIVEDVSLCKTLCDPSVSISVRLCRQRQPFLPQTTAARPTAAHIMDISIDTINHNLRRRLDVDLYGAATALIHRLIVCLTQNHIRLTYHWALLWQSALNLVRFLQTYEKDVKLQSSNIEQLTSPLLKILALSIVHGMRFLPNAGDYDDLVYKLVESHDILVKFKAAYPQASTKDGPLNLLVSTAAHFHTLLSENSKTKSKFALSSRDVSKVIRDGYESLELADVGGMGLESFEVWREGEERGMLKKAARTTVEDCRRIVVPESQVSTAK